MDPIFWGFLSSYIYLGTNLTCELGALVNNKSSVKSSTLFAGCLIIITNDLGEQHE